MSALRIGTRGSPLALRQARAVATAIRESGGPTCRLLTIKTTGDRLMQAALPEVGGKRLFVKEIEEALVADRVDLAVHSAKDLPADLPPGLTIGAALPREDPRDALVAPASRNDLPRDDATALIVTAAGASARIGTSSIRRTAQLAHIFSSVSFEPVRGNLGTRLRKLDAGNYDLLILAAAGLIRLELAHRITTYLPFEVCVPAPGQGIVAVETRSDDVRTNRVLLRVTDAAASAALRAERALVRVLGGDCQLPVGAVATPDRDELGLIAIVATPDGTRILRREGRARVADATDLGARVAEELLVDGARDILAAFDHP